MRKDIHAVIFDFGGVITRPQDEARKRAMIDTIGLSYRDFTRSYLLYREGYDAGRMKGTEYWARICIDHSIQVEHDVIKKLIRLDVKSWTIINETMIALASKLQGSNVKTALLSNMTQDILTYIRKKYPWLNDFTTCVFSCEHMVTKPDKRIYHICLQSLNEKAEDCLFIDDSDINLQSARDIGFNTILFQNERDLENEIKTRYQFT